MTPFFYGGVFDKKVENRCVNDILMGWCGFLFDFFEVVRERCVFGLRIYGLNEEFGSFLQNRMLKGISD